MRPFITLAAVALTAACVAPAATPPEPSPAVGIGTWLLQEGTLRGVPITVDAGTEPTLEIDGAGIGGRSHCNIYDGTIEIDGTNVRISAMSMTEMGCLDDELMTAEAAYLEALSLAETIEMSDDELVLSGSELELRFRFLPPVADAELIGTVWRLDSLISGDAVSSTLGDPATLAFSGDGTFEGSTGRRGFGGRYEASGAEVRVSDLVNDDRACMPDVQSQDDHVLAVLRDGFTHAIEGRGLTLMGPDGIGLGYRADDG